MKITIKHDQNSIDPSATCSDERFETVIDSLEAETEREIKKAYPEAEICFERVDCCGKSVIVEGEGFDDLTDESDEVQRICELVYETGNFWIC